MNLMYNCPHCNEVFTVNESQQENKSGIKKKSWFGITDCNHCGKPVYFQVAGGSIRSASKVDKISKKILNSTEEEILFTNKSEEDYKRSNWDKEKNNYNLESLLKKELNNTLTETSTIIKENNQLIEKLEIYSKVLKDTRILLEGAVRDEFQDYAYSSIIYLQGILNSFLENELIIKLKEYNDKLPLEQQLEKIKEIKKSTNETIINNLSLIIKNKKEDGSKLIFYESIPDYGFIEPFKTIKINSEEKEITDILQNLTNLKELINKTDKLITYTNKTKLEERIKTLNNQLKQKKQTFNEFIKEKIKQEDYTKEQEELEFLKKNLAKLEQLKEQGKFILSDKIEDYLKDYTHNITEEELIKKYSPMISETNLKELNKLLNEMTNNKKQNEQEYKEFLKTKIVNTIKPLRENEKLFGGNLEKIEQRIKELNNLIPFKKQLTEELNNWLNEELSINFNKKSDYITNLKKRLENTLGMSYLNIYSELKNNLKTIWQDVQGDSLELIKKELQKLKLIKESEKIKEEVYTSKHNDFEIAYFINPFNKEPEIHLYITKPQKANNPSKINKAILNLETLIAKKIIRNEKIPKITIFANNEESDYIIKKIKQDKKTYEKNIKEVDKLIEQYLEENEKPKIKDFKEKFKEQLSNLIIFYSKKDMRLKLGNLNLLDKTKKAFGSLTQKIANWYARKTENTNPIAKSITISSIATLTGSLTIKYALRVMDLYLNIKSGINQITNLQEIITTANENSQEYNQELSNGSVADVNSIITQYENTFGVQIDEKRMFTDPTYEYSIDNPNSPFYDDTSPADNDYWTKHQEEGLAILRDYYTKGEGSLTGNEQEKLNNLISENNEITQNLIIDSIILSVFGAITTYIGIKEIKKQIKKRNQGPLGEPTFYQKKIIGNLKEESLIIRQENQETKDYLKKYLQS